MDNAKPWVLEIRLFTVHPGTREEFHRISVDGTIPLMRSLGINVVRHGPSPNNEDGYFLIRAFPSEEQRIELGQSLYAIEEWLAKYEEPVMSMIADYTTAVIPVAPDAVAALSA